MRLPSAAPRHLLRPTLPIALALGACSGGTGPADGGLEPGTFNVTLSANRASLATAGEIVLTATPGNGARVTRVEFHERLVGVDAAPLMIAEDSLAPYELTRVVSSGAADNGTHEFTATAYDHAGAMAGSEPVAVTVDLDITSTPLTLQASRRKVVVPTTVTLDVPGTRALARVEIYEGQTKVAESTGHLDPRRVELRLGDEGDGTHTFTAKGYDLVGNVATSNAVTIPVHIQWDMVGPVERGPLIATDASGAVYLAGPNGRPDGDMATYRDVYVAKRSGDGALLWSRSFGGADWETPRSVAVDVAGRVVVAGDIYFPDQRRHDDCFLAVYDAAGSLQWTQRHERGSFCRAAADGFGQIFLSSVRSEEESDGASRHHGTIARYSATGERQWLREFEIPAQLGSAVALTGVASDATGDVFLAGFMSGSMDGTANRGGQDAFVLKFDADGHRMWAMQFGTAHHDWPTGIAVDGAGGVYVGLNRSGPGVMPPYSDDAVVARVSATGTLQWERVLDGGGNAGDWGYGVVADRIGVYFVGVLSAGMGNLPELRDAVDGDRDGFLARFASDGTLRYVHLMGGLSDWAAGVALSADGPPLVTALAGPPYCGALLPGAPECWILARHREATP